MTHSAPFDTSPTSELLAHPKTVAALRIEIEQWSQRIREGSESLGLPIAAEAFNGEGVAYAGQLGQAVLPVLKREVFAKLPRPYSILPDEVARIAGHHLSVLPADFDRQFPRFLRHCRMSELGAYTQRSEPFAVLTMDKDEHFPQDATTLYEGESGFKVLVAGFVPVATLGDPFNLAHVEMRVCIEARCSTEALGEAVREMQPLLKSVLTSLALAGHFEVGDNPDEEPRADQTGFDVVAECLNAYFRAPSKKDSLGGLRLRNAIRLLVEADNAQHSIVSLALCMSALEALVGSSKDGISEELARNTVALLQPNPLQRPANVQAIKRLYGRRSRLLHGDEVDDTGQGAHAARMLAAAAVKAVIEWRGWKRRLGEDAEQSVTFLEEIRQNGLAGRPMMGVPEALASRLPA